MEICRSTPLCLLQTGEVVAIAIYPVPSELMV